MAELANVVGWLSPVEGAALEMRYTSNGIVSSNLTPTADDIFNTMGANKNPTIETLQKIAKALDVGVDDLLK